MAIIRYTATGGAGAQTVVRSTPEGEEQAPVVVDIGSSLVAPAANGGVSDGALAILALEAIIAAIRTRNGNA